MIIKKELIPYRTSSRRFKISLGTEYSLKATIQVSVLMSGMVFGPLGTTTVPKGMRYVRVRDGLRPSKDGRIRVRYAMIFVRYGLRPC